MGRVRLQSRSQRWARGMGVGIGGSEEGEESGVSSFQGACGGTRRAEGGSHCREPASPSFQTDFLL